MRRRGARAHQAHRGGARDGAAGAGREDAGRGPGRRERQRQRLARMSEPTYHVLAPVNAPTTAAFDLCGFTQLTRRFVRLLRECLGVKVILYGATATDTPASEFVALLGSEEREELLAGVPYHAAPHDADAPPFARAKPRLL